MKKLVALFLALGLLLTAFAAFADEPVIGDGTLLYPAETWSSAIAHSNAKRLYEFPINTSAHISASIYEKGNGNFYVGTMNESQPSGNVTIWWNGVNSNGWHPNESESIDLLLRIVASNEDGSTIKDIPFTFYSGHNMESHEEEYIPNITEDPIPTEEQYRPEEKEPERIPVTWYPSNTVCVGGLEFRQEKPGLTKKWYNFAAIDLSKQGKQAFELVASNLYVIGVVIVDVDGDSVTVEWRLNKQGTVDANFKNESEFLTFFHDLASVESVEPSSIATSYKFGEPISIEKDLEGDTNVLLYIRNVATYCNNLSYKHQNPIFHPTFDRNDSMHVAIQKAMRALMAADAQ